MNYLSLTFSLVAGVALVAVSVIFALWRKKTPEMKHGILVFLMGPGILGGLRMFWRCLTDKTLGLEGDEKVYFVVGALCLIWMSTQEGVRAVKAMQQ